MTELANRLARAITLAGPIPVSQFMAAANAHYYATRNPLGAAGDFVTAPEVSQMFGELVGLWCADLWDRAGRPGVAWVELGPGRGTLAADALRAMAKAGLTPPVHFVETSPTLRALQTDRVPEATFHDDASTLPTDRPLLIVANEFFDALPIRQLVRGPDGWRERLVACQDTLFLPIAGKPVPDAVLPGSLRDAAPGEVSRPRPPPSPSCASWPAASRRRAGRCSRSTTAMKARHSATRSRRCAATPMPIPMTRPASRT
jgi:NADH dehydrogenase [ubiquinone] 1 alpha subcomplex assembly factor 7